MDIIKNDYIPYSLGNVFLKFENLTVWSLEQKGYFHKNPEPRKTILHNVSGHIKDGEFIIILGPSGAGKTTFLVSLAGKCHLPFEGSITLNGKDIKDLPRGAVEFVSQFDVFMKGLKVTEHLHFMAEMKLNLDKKKIKTILSRILLDLKLENQTHTLIEALSGGQRRLLSLAAALLSNPQVIICDEPTTGLDSNNALMVISVLKRLALSGKVVICSVHQPSSSLFSEFNSIILMAEGKLLFQGSMNECKAMFESINLHCPKNYNPAEFYMKSLAQDSNFVGNVNIDKIWTAHQSKPTKYEEDYYDPTMYLSVAQISRRNWFIQLKLLMWRFSIALSRDLRLQSLKIFFCIILSAAIIGSCYVGASGTTQRGIQDMVGFLTLISCEISFSLAYNARYSLEPDIVLFKREAGLYSTSAFYISKFLVLMPRCILWPIAYNLVVTSLVDLPNHFFTVMKMIFALIVTGVAASAYGLGMAGLLPSADAGGLMSVVDIPLHLMSGIFLSLHSLPWWLYPVKYMSHFYYSMDAISNIYWSQIDYIACSQNTTTNCLNDGNSVIWQMGYYSTDFVVRDGLGFFMITLFWNILGYIGLRREMKEGYAY